MIELQEVTKRFGDFVAIDKISLRVASGEIFAILGPNGSGKSTILKCIAGLTFPSAGQIRIADRDIGEKPNETKRLFSYLPQQVSFPESLTAREVVDFYCRLRQLPSTSATQALRSCSLNGFADKPIYQYSGGMLQRLGMALALLPNSPILLLDEPTAGLDPEVTLELRRILTDLRRRGRTVLFASHMLAEVEAIADRVGILVRGRLVTIESVATLRERLTTSSRMQVVLRNPSPAFTVVCRSTGATDAVVMDHCLLVTCRASLRLQILRALECAGARIESFFTEEPTLEEIYMRYLNENSHGGSATARYRLPGG